MAKIHTNELRKQARKSAGGTRDKHLKAVDVQRAEFITKLSDAMDTGEVTLPEELWADLFALNMAINSTVELDHGAPLKWTPELEQLLVVEVDKLRATINRDTGRKFSIDTACLKLQYTGAFINLRPTDTLYYKFRKTPT